MTATDRRRHDPAARRRPLADTRLMAQLRLCRRPLDRRRGQRHLPRRPTPRTGETIGHVAALTAAQARAATDAAEAAFPAWSTLLPQERSAILRRWHDADHRGPRGPRPPHDPRAGQAALRGARRDRLCRELRRVLRRGGPPPEHRGRHLAPADAEVELWREPAGVAALDHPLELPLRDDHPQGRRRARRRLHRGRSTRSPKPPSPPSRWPSSPSAPASRPASSTSSPATPRPSSPPGPRTAASASSPSPARPRSAACSTASPPTP